MKTGVKDNKYESTKQSKVGRPSKFTQELADGICDRIANSADGLRTICAEFNIPYQTVSRWISENEAFREQYARAKTEQAEFMVYQAIEIADSSEDDIKETEEGKIIIDYEHINRSRLRVDIRKWAASKLDPKKYGEKLDVTTDGSPIQVNIAPASGKKPDN